jgi:RHS repeat-associated protein
MYTALNTPLDGQFVDLVSNGAREYDPGVGAFTSYDPAILGGPTLVSTFGYARNNPITFFDPDGANALSERLLRELRWRGREGGRAAAGAANFVTFGISGLFDGQDHCSAGYRFGERAATGLSLVIPFYDALGAFETAGALGRGALRASRPGLGLSREIGVCSGTNCFNRALAMDQRMAAGGPVVSAIDGAGVLPSEVADILAPIYGEVEYGTFETLEDARNYISQYGDGTRAIVGYYPPELAGEGHAVNGVVLGSETHFFDAEARGFVELSGPEFHVWITNKGGGW